MQIGALGSCGRPFSIVEARIVDDGGNPLPAGEVGEIVCRGPQTMAYSWGKAEATAQAFRGSWLHTVSGKPGLDGKAIRKFAAARLADYKVPRLVEVWPDIPKSAAGKILRRAVRDSVLARTAAEASPI